MDKWQQIKIKNHYVWEYYLKNWAVGGKVYWVTPKGNIAFDSPKGMCREDGLYKINTLDNDDIQYLRWWSQQSPESLQKQHAKYFNKFTQISEIIKICRTQFNDNKEVKEIAEILSFNSLEDMYAGVERGAKTAIDGLAKGDFSVLEDEGTLIGLYSYLGHQITRTKGMKDRFFERAPKEIPLSKSRDEGIRLANKNWWFLCYMLGENVGWSLFSRRIDKRLFIINSSEVPFITGDSPVVNVHPGHDAIQKGKPSDFLDIYFPISPRYACMINTSSKWDYLCSGAGIKDVIELNSRVAGNARYSVYGSSKEAIAVCKNRIKQW